MEEYSVINNRKRAIIALVHSLFFLSLASWMLANAAETKPIWLANGAVGPFVMLVIYAIVSTILIQLTRISGCAKERLYFGFCASSATLGLLRSIFGDSSLHVGLYLRVAMLLCGVVTGIWILLGFSKVVPTAENQA